MEDIVRHINQLDQQLVDYKLDNWYDLESVKIYEFTLDNDSNLDRLDRELKVTIPTDDILYAIVGDQFLMNQSKNDEEEEEYIASIINMVSSLIIESGEAHIIFLINDDFSDGLNYLCSFILEEAKTIQYPVYFFNGRYGFGDSDVIRTFNIRPDLEVKSDYLLKIDNDRELIYPTFTCDDEIESINFQVFNPDIVVLATSIEGTPFKQLRGLNSVVQQGSAPRVTELSFDFSFEKKHYNGIEDEVILSGEAFPDSLSPTIVNNYFNAQNINGVNIKPESFHFLDNSLIQIFQRSFFMGSLDLNSVFTLGDFPINLDFSEADNLKVLELPRIDFVLNSINNWQFTWFDLGLKLPNNTEKLEVLSSSHLIFTHIGDTRKETVKSIHANWDEFKEEFPAWADYIQEHCIPIEDRNQDLMQPINHYNNLKTLTNYYCQRFTKNSPIAVTGFDAYTNYSYKLEFSGEEDHDWQVILPSSLINLNSSFTGLYAYRLIDRDLSKAPIGELVVKLNNNSSITFRNCFNLLFKNALGPKVREDNLITPIKKLYLRNSPRIDWYGKILTSENLKFFDWLTFCKDLEVKLDATPDVSSIEDQNIYTVPRYNKLTIYIGDSQEINTEDVRVTDKSLEPIDALNWDVIVESGKVLLSIVPEAEVGAIMELSIDTGKQLYNISIVVGEELATFDLDLIRLLKTSLFRVDETTRYGLPPNNEYLASLIYDEIEKGNYTSELNISNIQTYYEDDGTTMWQYSTNPFVVTNPFPSVMKSKTNGRIVKDVGDLLTQLRDLGIASGELSMDSNPSEIQNFIISLAGENLKDIVVGDHEPPVYAISRKIEFPIIENMPLNSYYLSSFDSGQSQSSYNKMNIESESGDLLNPYCRYGEFTLATRAPDREWDLYYYDFFILNDWQIDLEVEYSMDRLADRWLVEEIESDYNSITKGNGLLLSQTLPIYSIGRKLVEENELFQSIEINNSGSKINIRKLISDITAGNGELVNSSLVDREVIDIEDYELPTTSFRNQVTEFV